MLSYVVAGPQHTSWHVACEFASGLPAWAAAATAEAGVSPRTASLLRDGSAFLVSLHRWLPDAPDEAATLATGSTHGGGSGGDQHLVSNAEPVPAHAASSPGAAWSADALLARSNTRAAGAALPVASPEALTRLLQAAAAAAGPQQPAAADGTPLPPRCPWLLPCIGALAVPGCGATAYVFPAVQFSLDACLRFSPAALDSDPSKRLLLYQTCAALAAWHEASGDVPHGAVHPGSLRLNELGAVALAPPHACWPLSTAACIPSRLPYGDVGGGQAARVGRDPGVRSLAAWCAAWTAGDVSTWEYVLALNAAAGRRPRDRAYHVMVPWVLDMTAPPEAAMGAAHLCVGSPPPPGWRDLRRTKWRLAKGDEQLDASYARSQPPHHVNDEPLSELAVCIYTARVQHVALLQRCVRSVWEPGEYPGTMERLYAWTPDECIPEFYCDPEVFTSRHIHLGLPDLAPPKWAADAADFVARHRAALDSDVAAAGLHSWIDLMFGCALTGAAAVTAKNVALPPADPSALRTGGRAQLFSGPHPARRRRNGEDTTIARPAAANAAAADDKPVGAESGTGAAATHATLSLPLQLLRTDLDASSRMAAALRAAVSPRSAGTGGATAAAISAFALDPLGASTPFAAHMRAVTSSASGAPGAFTAAMEALEAAATQSITGAAENLLSAMSLSTVLPGTAAAGAGSLRGGKPGAPAVAQQVVADDDDDGGEEDSMEMQEVVAGPRHDGGDDAWEAKRDGSAPKGLLPSAPAPLPSIAAAPHDAGPDVHPLDVDHAAVGRLIIALWGSPGLDACWETPAQLAAALPELPPGVATYAAALLRLPWGGVSPPPRVRRLAHLLQAPALFPPEVVAAAAVLQPLTDTPIGGPARLAVAASLLVTQPRRLRGLGLAGGSLVLPMLAKSIQWAVDACPESQAMRAGTPGTQAPTQAVEVLCAVAKAASSGDVAAHVLPCLLAMLNHPAFSPSACEPALHAHLRVALGTGGYAHTVLPLLCSTVAGRKHGGAALDAFVSTAPFPVALRSVLRPVLDDLLAGCGGSVTSLAVTATCLASAIEAAADRPSTAKYLLPLVMQALDGHAATLAAVLDASSSSLVDDGGAVASASPLVPPTMPAVPTTSSGSAKRLAALQAAAAAAVALRDALERGAAADMGSHATSPAAVASLHGALHAACAVCRAVPLQALNETLLRAPLTDGGGGDTRASVAGGASAGQAASTSTSASPASMSPLLRLLLGPTTPWTCRLAAAGALTACLQACSRAPIAELPPGARDAAAVQVAHANAVLGALRPVFDAAAAARPKTAPGGGGGGGVDVELLMALFPPFVDILGLTGVRSALPCALLLERKLMSHSSWLPPALHARSPLLDGSGGGLSTASGGPGSRSPVPTAEQQHMMLLTDRDRQAARALEGLQRWGSGSEGLGGGAGSRAAPAPTTPGAASPGLGSAMSPAAASSPAPAPWWWLPGEDLWALPQSAFSSRTPSGGPPPSRSFDGGSPTLYGGRGADVGAWALRMRIVHEWRAAAAPPPAQAAAPGASAAASGAQCVLRGVVASPDEALCVTVGADALRVWSLALPPPHASALLSQYGHHRGTTPVAAALLHAPSLLVKGAVDGDEGDSAWGAWAHSPGNTAAHTAVCSVDTRGGVHIWHASTGARRCCLGEPGTAVGSSGGSVLGGDASRCFTSLLALDAGLEGTLLAGLQDGRVRGVDARVGTLLPGAGCLG